MFKAGRKVVYRAILVAALIAAAYSLRFFTLIFPRFDGNDTAHIATLLIRSAIYMGIVVVWGFSVRHRIIHPKVMRLFVAIASLMFFWMVVRTAKFTILVSPALTRYLWYLYYVPLLFIPMLSFRLSMWLGRPDEYRLPSWTKILFPLTIALLVLVLTNDAHELVFSFPKDIPTRTDRNYSWGPLFWPVIAWEWAGLFSTVSMILIRSRVPGGKRIMLPAIPVAVLFVYAVIFLADDNNLIKKFTLGGVTVLEDLTVMETMLIIAIFECCLRCGLISANTHYVELFEALGYTGVITDEDYNMLYITDSYVPMEKAQMKEAENGPLDLGDGLLLKNMELSYGHILWTENVSEIMRLQSEAAAMSKELEAEKDLLQAEIEIKQKEASLDTRNRLYDAVVREIPGQFEKIDALVSAEYENETERSDALKRMCVLGAYIKRRCNLLIISEEHSLISSDELFYCLRESMDYMRLSGAECVLNAAPHEDGKSPMIPVDISKLAYDVFERVAETVLDTLSAMLVVMEASGDGLLLKLQAEYACPAIDFSDMEGAIRSQNGMLSHEFEEGVLYAKICFKI